MSTNCHNSQPVNYCAVIVRRSQVGGHGRWLTIHRILCTICW